MRLRNKAATLQFLLLLCIAVLSILLFLPLSPLSEGGGIGNPNTSVITRVNVTNAAPYVYNLSIIAPPITLTPNVTTLAWCSAIVEDLNTVADIFLVNATLYDKNFSQHNSIDYNTTHYTNSSCTNFSEIDTFNRLYNCTFNLWYNSNPGNWMCNITAADTTGVTDDENISITINELIALMVGDLIDFGKVAVLNYSDNIPFNVTNVGNRNINVSVYAYGAQDNDTLAMVCDYGNISIGNIRVSINSSNITSPVDFNTMTIVNNTNATPTRIGNFTILQYNATYNMSINTSVWRLYVSNAGRPSGICNGTVVFRALRA